MAPLIKELEKHPDELQLTICTSAQHREMLDQIMGVFNIRPDYDLDLMRAGQTLTDLAARMLTALDEVLQRENPDWLLVQGDTTTVMIGALAAFHRRIQVGHVEAGLRTGDKMRPYPEEVNRRVADILSDMHFAPTETNRQNLLREGVKDETIILTGNTVIDAMHLVVERARRHVRARWASGLSGRRILLVTVHRRETFGLPLEEICRALLHIASRYESDVQIIYPVHLNPSVWDPVHRALNDIPNITLTAPQNYMDFVGLLDQSYLVLTDSGGLQEEAPGLGKPVLVLRDVTERPEGVAAGTVKVVGTSFPSIVEETTKMLDDEQSYKSMARAVNPYGDGRASQRIVAALLGQPAHQPVIRTMS